MGRTRAARSRMIREWRSPHNAGADGCVSDNPRPGPPQSGGRGTTALPTGRLLAATTLAIGLLAATGVGLASTGTGCAFAGSATACLGNLLHGGSFHVGHGGSPLRCRRVIASSQRLTYASRKPYSSTHSLVSCSHEPRIKYLDSSLAGGHCATGEGTP